MSQRTLLNRVGNQIPVNVRIVTLFHFPISVEFLYDGPICPRTYPAALASGELCCSHYYKVTNDIDVIDFEDGSFECEANNTFQCKTWPETPCQSHGIFTSFNKGNFYNNL